MSASEDRDVILTRTGAGVTSDFINQERFLHSKDDGPVAPEKVVSNGNKGIEKEKLEIVKSGSSSKIGDGDRVLTATCETVADEMGLTKIRPSDNVWTSDYSASVKLRMKETGLGSAPPISVPSLLHRAATCFPDYVALSHKGEDGKWINITYREYEQMVRIVAKAFLKLGLKRYHSVCIIGFNTPQWLISDLAAIYAGGFAAGMYTTNTPEACFHCLESSRANICVVEDEKQLVKILEVREKLPELRAIIQYVGTPSRPGILSWGDVLKMGQEQSNDPLDAVLQTICVNDCCTLVYTSGTEGQPKAVMLSHDNLTWDARSVATYLGLETGVESVVSFLPLSHVAAQVADIYIVMTVAATTYFADPDAFKGSLVKTLTEVHPTVFLGVPRVWEKIYEKMQSIGKQTTGLKKVIATYAKATATQHHLNVMNGDGVPSYSYQFFRWLVFSKIKMALGLDRCKVFITAAAPLSLDIKKYFMSIDIPISEAFGMSECSGGHTLGKPSDFNLDGVGKTLPGCLTVLSKPNIEGHGEICMEGRHVFMGYLNDPEKTEQCTDDNGRLYSGDIGRVDERGILHITGRSKEILITAGGENVAPVLIEHTVQAELPQISNAFLIGDQRKYLTILLTWKTDMHPESGAPLDTVTSEVKSWFRELGYEGTTVTQFLQDKPTAVMNAVQEGINRANAKSISNAQRVQKFTFLPQDFSVPTGELGPTLKVKRSEVTDKYKETIEELYNDS